MAVEKPSFQTKAFPKSVYSRDSHCCAPSALLAASGALLDVRLRLSRRRRPFTRGSGVHDVSRTRPVHSWQWPRLAGLSPTSTWFTSLLVNTHKKKRRKPYNQRGWWFRWAPSFKRLLSNVPAFTDQLSPYNLRQFHAENACFGLFH